MTLPAFVDTESGMTSSKVAVMGANDPLARRKDSVRVAGEAVTVQALVKSSPDGRAAGANT
jgi:hypothetical protein